MIHILTHRHANIPMHTHAYTHAFDYARTNIPTCTRVRLKHGHPVQNMTAPIHTKSSQRFCRIMFDQREFAFISGEVKIVDNIDLRLHIGISTNDETS